MNKEMKNNEIALNLILIAAICCYAVSFYAIHKLDWFLILLPLIIVLILVVAVTHMDRSVSPIDKEHKYENRR